MDPMDLDDPDDPEDQYIVITPEDPIAAPRTEPERPRRPHRSLPNP